MNGKVPWGGELLRIEPVFLSSVIKVDRYADIDKAKDQAGQGKKAVGLYLIQGKGKDDQSRTEEHDCPPQVFGVELFVFAGLFLIAHHQLRFAVFPHKPADHDHEHAHAQAEHCHLHIRVHI